LAEKNTRRVIALVIALAPLPCASEAVLRALLSPLSSSFLTFPFLSSPLLSPLDLSSPLLSCPLRRQAP